MTRWPYIDVYLGLLYFMIPYDRVNNGLWYFPWCVTARGVYSNLAHAAY